MATRMAAPCIVTTTSPVPLKVLHQTLTVLGAKGEVGKTLMWSGGISTNSGVGWYTYGSSIAAGGSAETTPTDSRSPKNKDLNKVLSYGYRVYLTLLYVRTC
jgi:hypothetical protein